VDCTTWSASQHTFVVTSSTFSLPVLISRVHLTESTRRSCPTIRGSLSRSTRRLSSKRRRICQFGAVAGARSTLAASSVSCSSLDCCKTRLPTGSELVACYNSTLTELLDKFAPWRLIRTRARLTAPWFDAGCHHMKTTTRKLEKAYRRRPSAESRSA